MRKNLEFAANELPIACTLSGQDRFIREEEVTEIFKDVQQVNELTDGYAFRFHGSETWAIRLTEFIVMERKCCPFFAFELIFEPNQGSIWLNVRGSEDIKEIIAGMLKS